MTWGWGQHFPGSRNKMYKTRMPKTACHILRNHKKFLITVSKICGQTWNMRKRAVQKQGGQRTWGEYHQDVWPWFWQLCDSDMAELHLQTGQDCQKRVKPADRKLIWSLSNSHRAWTKVVTWPWVWRDGSGANRICRNQEPGALWPGLGNTGMTSQNASLRSWRAQITWVWSPTASP